MDSPTQSPTVFILKDYSTNTKISCYIVDIRSSVTNEPIIIYSVNNVVESNMIHVSTEHLFKIPKKKIIRFLPKILIDDMLIRAINKPINYTDLHNNKIYLYNPINGTKIAIDINNPDAKKWLNS